MKKKPPPTTAAAKRQAVPKSPPPGHRRAGCPEYMRWYRAARKAGIPTYRRPRPTLAQRREWRRKYQRAYRQRMIAAKGNA